MAIEFQEGQAERAGWEDVPSGYATIVKPASPPEHTEEEIEVSGVEHPDADVRAHPPQVVEDRPLSTPQPPPAVVYGDALTQIAQAITSAVSGQSAISQRRMGSDQAAEIILGMIPENCVHAIRDRAFQTHSHPLEIIAGVIVQIGGQGLLGEMSLNPTWKDYLRSIDTLAISASTTSNTQSLISRSLECPQCQATFTAERDGQKYCCNGCGKVAAGYRERYSHSIECKTPAAALVQQKRSRDEAEARARAQEALQQDAA